MLVARRDPAGAAGRRPARRGRAGAGRRRAGANSRPVLLDELEPGAAADLRRPPSVERSRAAPARGWLRRSFSLALLSIWRMRSRDEPQRLADLLQRARLLAVEAEAHADHLALLLVQLRHQRADLLLEGRLRISSSSTEGIVSCSSVSPSSRLPSSPTAVESERSSPATLQQLLDLLLGQRPSSAASSSVVGGRSSSARQLLARVADLRDLARQLLGQAEHARAARRARGRWPGAPTTPRRR